MKRHLFFLFMAVSLVLLAACSVVDSEQGWTTISQSKTDEPSYSLQAKDNHYRIHYYENSSARKDWYLNNYQPALNLKMRTLNSEQLKNTEGGSVKQELSGTGYADFTMVYETRYNPQIERTYFKVHIEVNDKGDVDTKKSSMTYWKTEEEVKDNPPVD
ncbi:hypothetical protein D8880_11260 [Streptococcus sanguinis]|jgi:putative lipoprotein|uniref:Lipoprotein n=1 Tax=Streptococcus sanguinis SK1087 TaxID=888824 RepID=F3SH45_STRSA|nr:hypothetical protein [Streptococcus sanguinis]EGG40653.1 lipoprotein [Streptococcus sanguinis SK1087]ETD07879.1 hypothetical protein HMPREF1196_00935 [Streptococcus sanguinis CC94A]RSI22606.1 hypothetical protein D8880_11260 [Streptococcus sanguinis]